MGTGRTHADNITTFLLVHCHCGYRRLMVSLASFIGAITDGTKPFTLAVCTGVGVIEDGGNHLKL
jgi:hypothetical protein